MSKHPTLQGTECENYYGLQDTVPNKVKNRKRGQ